MIRRASERVRVVTFWNSPSLSSTPASSSPAASPRPRRADMAESGCGVAGCGGGRGCGRVVGAGGARHAALFLCRCGGGPGSGEWSCAGSRRESSGCGSGRWSVPRKVAVAPSQRAPGTLRRGEGHGAGTGRLAGWQAEGDSWASRSTELHTARARSLCLSPLSRSSSSLLDPVARSQALAALRALRCDQHACRSSTGIQSTTKPPPGPSSRSAHLPQAPRNHHLHPHHPHHPKTLSAALPSPPATSPALVDRECERPTAPAVAWRRASRRAATPKLRFSLSSASLSPAGIEHPLPTPPRLNSRPTRRMLWTAS